MTFSGTHVDPTAASRVHRFPPLTRGILLRRYKRFLADVRLDDGTEVTAHCPNSGSMRACSEPGRPVYVSRSDNPRRRLEYTWELIEMHDSFVCVNTLVPNRLLKQAIAGGAVPELAGYSNVRSEVRCSSRSRIDLLLEADGRAPCFVEIKSCTLTEGSRCSFPDAVTVRGRKHMVELQDLVRAGNRGVVFFLVQRMGARVFGPADHIDPEYGQELRNARRNGVEILCYDVRLNGEFMELNERLPVELDER